MIRQDLEEMKTKSQEENEENYNNIDLTSFIKFLEMYAGNHIKRILKQYKKE